MVEGGIARPPSQGRPSRLPRGAQLLYVFDFSLGLVFFRLTWIKSLSLSILKWHVGNAFEAIKTKIVTERSRGDMLYVYYLYIIFLNQLLNL